MTIIYKNLSGFGEQRRNIKCTTPWQKEMETDSSMRFYKGNPKYLVDVTLGEKAGDVMVFTYPHNGKADIGVFLDSHNEELEQLILKVFRDSGHTKTFVTIDAETMTEIVPDDFNRYSPDPEFEHQIFIFYKSPEDKNGFPHIWSVPKNSLGGMYSNLFKVQNMASQYVYPPSGKDTEFGKKATFILFNSVFEGKFTVSRMDYKDLRFPSNGENQVSEFLNTKNLAELLTRAGLEDLIQKDGEIVFNEKKEKKPVTDIGENPFETENESRLKASVNKQFLDCGNILLTDLANLGTTVAISMLPHELIIPVEMDIECGVKKMCLFEGGIHYIPTNDEFDITLILEDAELLFMDDEDSFPRYNKSAKKGD